MKINTISVSQLISNVKPHKNTEKGNKAVLYEIAGRLYDKEELLNPQFEKNHLLQIIENDYSMIYISFKIYEFEGEKIDHEKLQQHEAIKKTYEHTEF